MGLAHVIRTEASGHRFHTLAFAGKQQTRAIGLQRNGAIQVPRGLRQAIKIGREAFLLGAWRSKGGAHGTSYHPEPFGDPILCKGVSSL
jgi:hypothetical protein